MKRSELLSVVRAAKEVEARTKERKQVHADVIDAFQSLGYRVQIDSFNRVTFDSVDTTRLLKALGWSK